MALRSVTLEDLRKRVAQAAGIDDLSFVVDTEEGGELDQLINRSIGEMHDELCSIREDYVLEYLELSLTGSSYQLPDDAWQVRGVDRIESNGEYTPLERQEWESRGINHSPLDPYITSYVGSSGLPTWNIEGEVIKFFPSSMPPGNVRVTYVPVAPVLTGSADTLPKRYVINGWDEFIDLDAGAKILDKDESDSTALRSRKEQIVRRIKAAAHRDATGTRKVQFIRSGWANRRLRGFVRQI